MMPVVSDSARKTKCVLPSMQQLKMVFALCDPQQTGIVTVDHLQELAKHYAAEDTKELEDILRLFDPQEKGAISFREFYKGVRSILRRRYHDEKNSKCRESMMSPSPAPVTEPAIDHQREPRFVLTPSTPSSPPPTGDVPTTERDQPLSKSQCSSLSDGENYECYGEGVELDLDSGIASDRTNGDATGARSPLNHSGINRHTWLRTSLRRSPPSHQENLPNRRWGSFRHSGKRQLGSNALASSSFNSSGRSSTCDTADDMYSDVSLEEDVVLDLNHRLHSLQQQVGELKDSANHNDERYTRAKAENAALQARVHMLEEQLREAEVRHEDRLQDEQRRAKELLTRVEREKQLQLENVTIRLQSLELEVSSLREEAARQKGRAERLEAERLELGEQLHETRTELSSARAIEHTHKEQEKRLTLERNGSNQLIDELSREVERLRSEARTPALPTTSAEQIRLEELHQEVSTLRSTNKSLLEANEELQASLLTAGVEQGRLLTAGETSLAAELEAMSHDQQFQQDDHENLAKMQQALKEQQDVNLQLRCYIDGILLNIVENYPQLLEVKQRSA